MIKEEAKSLLEEGFKLTHESFKEGEFIVLKKLNEMVFIEDEQGMIVPENTYWKLTVSEIYNDGWSVFTIEEPTENNGLRKDLRIGVIGHVNHASTVLANHALIHGMGATKIEEDAQKNLNEIIEEGMSIPYVNPYKKLDIFENVKVHGDFPKSGQQLRRERRSKKNKFRK